MKALLIFLSIVFFAFVSIFLFVKSVTFKQQCSGHLKLAADANTVSLAKEQLKIAVDYLEKNGLTQGYTSVFWKTQDEDIGFWYKNIKASLTELENLPENADPLVKSNMLIKLRETLLDVGQKTSVTVPDGISRYPNNGFYGFLFWLSLIPVIIVVLYAYSEV